MLRSVSARAGQIVSAGAPLLEVGNLKQVWLRVPVYAGDLASIDDKEKVSFDRFGAVVNDMREAQGLMMPLMLVLTFPFWVWFPISQSPNSTFARTLSQGNSV